MARILYTVQNLVNEVRAQLDENNVDSVDTDSDILPSLNRGQDYGFDILARMYPEPILTHSILQLESNVAEYDIPETLFEDRLQKIEISIPGVQPFVTGSGSTFREVQRVSYRDLSNYESASRTNVPYYYAIFGRKVRFVPTPTGIYNCRIWGLRNPEKLVLPQGRITVINTASNYLIVDQIGSSIVTEADQLGSYVNLVDGQTGDIKGTMQVLNVTGNKVTFKSVPTRTDILSRTVTGAITALPVTVELDDYICGIDGTCVPYYGRPLSNFMIQFSVAEIVRKLGGASATEESVLQKFEQQVERTWVGREQQLRIKKRSQNWGVPSRRWYYE